MRLSQKCLYALDAALELARHPTDATVTIGAIAEAQGIPPMFLQMILRELKGTGIVDSRRGKDGGYFLAVSPRQVSMAQVIRCIDGAFVPDDDGEDPVRRTWRDLCSKTEAMYEAVTLADLLHRPGTSGEVMNFSI